VVILESLIIGYLDVSSKIVAHIPKFEGRHSLSLVVNPARPTHMNYYPKGDSRWLSPYSNTRNPIHKDWETITESLHFDSNFFSPVR
jgi:hypothetical protein